MSNNSMNIRRLITAGAIVFLTAMMILIGETTCSFAEEKLGLNGSGELVPISDDSYNSTNSYYFSSPLEGSQITINSDDQKQCDINEAGKIVTYKFTAPEDGYYYVYSESSESLDTHARICVPDGSSYRQIGYDDESGDSNQFKIELRARAGNVYYIQASLYNDELTGSFTVHIEKEVYSASISVNYDRRTGNAVVSGTVTGDTFEDLYVDGERCYAGIDGDTTFSNVEINMKDYGFGSHTIYAVLNKRNSESDYVRYNGDLVVSIYETPKIVLEDFKTGSGYFTYNPGSSDYDFYIEYRKKGTSAWTAAGHTESYKEKKVSGLKASTNYEVRVYYGKVVFENGKDVLISGKSNGYVSNVITFKTGAKKPAIKSIKISKVKQKSSIYRQPIWGRRWIGTMLYMYIAGYRNVRVYTTKFKVTVNLKKKPGAAGIYLNGKKMKGNKKKYTTTMELSGKMKGKKYKFSVYSYQSSTYEGYSPVSKKKVKIR